MSMYNGCVTRGIESWSSQMCHQLAAMGHECILIQGGNEIPPDDSFETFSVDCAFPDRTDMGGLVDRVLSTFELHKIGRETMVFASRCIEPLTRFAPDVIVPVNGSPAVVAAAQVYRKFRAARTRVVVRTPGGYNSNVRRAMFLGVHGIAASEPYALEKISKRSKVPSALIPLGIDVARFQSAKPVHLDLEGPVVITTSALRPFKRVQLAVHAAARAGMSLLVLGDGPLRPTICKLGAELLGERRFRWCPFVPFDEVPGYYKAAQVFTLPSEATEAFGVVILEALAAGLPVVVNDDPVRRWIVTESGCFVDPRDVDSYAAALQHAAAIGTTKGTVESLRRFHWATVAQQWSDFFDLLRSTAGPASL